MQKYKEALHLNPIDAWSWLGLADSYYQLSRYSIVSDNLLELADNAYRKAIDLDPLNWYYLEKHAGFLLNSRNADWPIQRYKGTLYAISNSKTSSLIAMTFADGKSYEEIADLAFAAQDINKALVYYKKAEAARENNENAKLGQLRCYSKMSLMKDILLIYKKSRYSIRNKSIFFASLGEYYLNKGYAETARRFSEKSVAMDSKNPEAYQLEYKISKKTTGSVSFLTDEVSNILNFNRVPVLADFRTGDFNLNFDIKKDMYGGIFSIDMFLPAGIYEISVHAKGQAALGIQPHMIVKFNDKNKIDVYVSDDWEEYSGIIVVDCSANRFDIVFDNDYYDEGSMEDRNLFIDGVRLKAL